MVYCDKHEDSQELVREISRAHVELTDKLDELTGKMDALLVEMQNTRVDTRLAHQALDNHIQNVFIHLNKWYASAIIMGGIVAAILTNVAKWGIK